MGSPELFSFLSTQKLCVLATGVADEIWTSNVFYGVDASYTLYFISSQEAKHSQHILQNSNIAFSIARFNAENHTDRKAVQGQGVCKMTTDLDQISLGVSLHNTHFPEFADRITVDRILSEENASHVWIITPSQMKFWNDELYGINGTQEFLF